jgi:excisionase family DNA binding protein
MEQIEGKNYYTINELAERLKVSRYTIQRYVYSGRLQAIKVRRMVYITEESYNSLFEPKPHIHVKRSEKVKS